MKRKKRDIDRTIEDMWGQFSGSLVMRALGNHKEIPPEELRLMRTVFFAGSAAMYELVNTVFLDDETTPRVIFDFRMRVERELARYVEQSETEIAAQEAAGPGGELH